MSGRQRKLFVVSDLRGGLNTADPDLIVPDNQCTYAANIEWWVGSMGGKRWGATAVTSGGISTLTGVINSLARFVPAADETAAQLVGIDADGVMAKIAAGSAWSAALTPTDAFAVAWDTKDTVQVTFNGKLFQAYNSAVDRLHYLDSAGVHHRCGLAQPAAAPTVGDTGSGAYAATARTYKVAWTTQVAGVTTLRSELSASVSPPFTPSGAGTAARVTRPTAAGEDETHWELYAAATTGDTTYHRIATTAIATTIYDDSAAPASYTGNAPPASGTNTVPYSCKYLVADGTRLLMAGSHESQAGSRVWFTPVLGSSNVGDDLRVPTDNYVSLGENDGDVIAGLGNINGTVYVFKTRQTWQLLPTGLIEAPYQALNISRTIGCGRHHSIVAAEDHNGVPSLYFWSRKGPYRLGDNGLEYLGRDISDFISAYLTSTSVHGVFHGDKHQVWWWLASGVKLCLDTELLQWRAEGTRGGWSNHTGESAKAACSVMFSGTLGATMSRDLKPYIGQTGTWNALWKCDDSTSGTDGGTAFTAGLYLPYRALGGNGARCQIFDPLIVADSLTGVTLVVGLVGDFGLITGTPGSALLTGEGSETQVIKKVHVQQAGLAYAQLQIGDLTGTGAWALQRVIIPYETEETL